MSELVPVVGRNIRDKMSILLVKWSIRRFFCKDCPCNDFKYWCYNCIDETNNEDLILYGHSKLLRIKEYE